MSNFEIGYCSLEEYEAGRENRIKEESLCIGGLYVVMFSLPGGRRRAAKFPSKVNHIDRLDELTSLINFTIMNIDLMPDTNLRNAFRDGIMQSSRSHVFTLAGDEIREGYFKEDYLGSDGEDELQDMIKQAQILESGRELVTVA